MGRCEDINDVWIAGEFDIEKVACDENAKEESLKLSKRAESFIEKSYFTTDEILIGYLNVRSLRKHWVDVNNDPELNKCHVIGLGETWLQENETVELQNFKSGTFVSGGFGKGVAAFSKIPLKNEVKALEPTFSFLSMDIELNTTKVSQLRLLFVYLSKDADFQTVKLKLRPLLTLDLPTVICGDMNFHYSEKSHTMKDYFEDFGFKQMIEEATHDDGNLLDQMYVYPAHLFTVEDVNVKPLYFSDHDALFLKLGANI